MKDQLKKEMHERGVACTIVHKTIGYELRAADPIPYDLEYTRNLGYGAVRFLLLGGTGSMVVFYEGRLKAVPFVELADPVTGKTRLRLVDITSETYQVALEYMIRLLPGDLEGEEVHHLAKAACLSVDDFRKRFQCAVEMRCSKA